MAETFVLNGELLKVYLHDHLAGATAGVELSRHLSEQQSENDFGPVLHALASDIEGDRTALRAILSSLGFDEHTPMEAVSWLGERLSRLKSNGTGFTASPLTMLVELEALGVGIQGKRSCWITLRTLADKDDRISPTLIDELVERASDQTEIVERLRVLVVRRVLLTQAAK